MHYYNREKGSSFNKVVRSPTSGGEEKIKIRRGDKVRD